MKRLFFVIALLVLATAEFLRVYFVMPFPGSQVHNTVSIAWWLERTLPFVRVLVLLFVFYVLFDVFRRGRLWQKIVLPLFLLGYGVVFYAFNYRLAADKIFYQPVNKSFSSAFDPEMDRTKLVIGVVINGEAKAYPIQLIGYHHQVVDTIGGTPVLITYCTVCRSARVFSPMVNGKPETFRLVGMDHFNAVFEDASTKSWWQQATGTAINGPLKGTTLKEYPSTQLTLDIWLRQNPTSLVLKPDPLFMDRYFKLEDYDKGTMQSPLVRRDNSSWQHNSWVVGVANSYASKAYDWNDLLEKRMIQDSVEGTPILVTIEKDSASFHAYDRRIDDNRRLSFAISADDKEILQDRDTHSSWTMDGVCIEGLLKGKRLLPVQAYNEFWHSWQTFHRAAKVTVSSYAASK